MKASEIRKKYLDFFAERGHKIIPSASLLPENDPTTLFTGSGMQPMIPYLLGEAHPEGKRLVNSQKCFRGEDIEEVGDNRHTTFFEMLGNWSLGDYGKYEQLNWFFDFLVDRLGLDKNRLYVTVFEGDKGIPMDDEAAQIWREILDAHDVLEPKKKIHFYGAEKNWWSRSGKPEAMPVGEPGGPDSEVFFDFGTEHDTKYGAECHPNCECGRFLEIGNSVFMQYRKLSDGSFEPLPQKNIDFGGGLERIVAALEDKTDIFLTSTFAGTIKKIEEVSGTKYEGDNKQNMRVIADHIRAATFLITDGVIPSNVDKGYVARKLIRRAIWYVYKLRTENKIHKLGHFVKETAAEIIDSYKTAYPELDLKREDTLLLLDSEALKFEQTIDRGHRELNKLMKDKAELTGEIGFTLFDTYGFPAELSKEIVQKVAKNFDQEFGKLMEAQKTRSRTATTGQFKGGLADHSAISTWYHSLTHLTYAGLRKVLGSHVHQRGSNITPERLRFDFSHGAKMTDEEKKKVEEFVNSAIGAGLVVNFEEYSKEEAFAKGAYGEFGHKYGDKVKVYKMEEPATAKVWSFEICGGPHVKNTSEIKGKYRIIKEESIAAGIRRIKGVIE